MSDDIEARRRIAEGLLGGALLGEAWGGFAPCPGAGSHTGKDGAKDFKVMLEGAPTGHCVHESCSGAVADWNKEFRRAVWRHEHGGALHDGTRPKRTPLNQAAAPEPQAAKLEKRMKLDRAAVERVTQGVPAITREWLRRRSPVDVRSCGLEGFFAALYEPGERVLVFTRFTSQGDFAWWRGEGGRKDGGYRLGAQPGISATPSAMPVEGKCGVWFLAQPCDSQWHPVKHLSSTSGRKLSRRSEPGVTAWRYLVLESDELEEAQWLRVVATIKLPVAAIYTSGGKSIHALVRVDAPSKPEWDLLRDDLSPLLTMLGADGAAMSGVRLTRLPFCLRHGTEKRDGTYVKYAPPRRQELLWLDPDPEARGLLAKPELRD